MAKDKQKETEEEQATTPVEEQEKETKNEEVQEDVKTEQDSQLEDLTAERDALSDKYMRAQAEIVNMRRRNEKEQASLIKYDGQKLAKSILPALDNLERALAVDVEHSEQLQKGVQMVQNDLLKALKDNHIEEIEAEGQAFDPNLHQAVQTVAADDEHPAETIVQVLQKGYVLKDRVLRPAMVIVAQ